MKNLLFLLSFCIFHSLNAQTTDAFAAISPSLVPNEVLASFNNQYAASDDEEWKKFRDIYEVKHKDSGKIIYSRYNKQGLFIENRILLDWENAPEQLKSGKNKTNQKYWEVTEFYKRVSKNKGISYILQLKNKSGEVETLYFDESGELDVKSKSGY